MVEDRTPEELACLARRRERQPLEDLAARCGALATWWDDEGTMRARLPRRRDGQPLADAGVVVLPTQFSEGSLAGLLRQLGAPVAPGVRWSFGYFPADDVVRVTVDGSTAVADELARRHGTQVHVHLGQITR